MDVLCEAVNTYRSECTTHDESIQNSIDGAGSDGPTDNSEVVVSDGTLDESRCGRQTSFQLFYTARSMFEMFAGLVPVYHRHLLGTLPQLAGNNSKAAFTPDTCRM